MKTRTIALACAALFIPAPALYAEATVGLNFTASTFGVDSGFIPPDTMAAVGRDHIVELINGRYSVYSKATGSRVQTSSLDSFWISAGVSLVGFSFDPRVAFDPFEDRWYAAAVDNAGGANSFLIAVSNTVDPTQGWTAYKIDTDANNSDWADFPMLGFNADGLFVSANMFPIGGGSSNTALAVIPKADLLAGSVANATLFEDVSANGTGYSPQPVVDVVDGGQPEQLLSWYNSTNLKLSSVTGMIDAPVLDTAGGFIAIDSKSAPPSAEQPGTKQNIDSGDSRFSGRVVRRGGSLWGVHSISENGRAALRWFEIDLASQAVAQTGILGDASFDYHRGSIAVIGAGDVVIGCSGSSEEQYVSTYAFVGTTTGGATTFDAPLLLKAGVDDYQLLDGIGRNRWGDYSNTVVDPDDQNVFWTIQEFVSADNVWSTQITQLTIDGDGGDRWVFNYPERDSIWLLTGSQFVMENDDCEWGPVSGNPPELGSVRGRIVCDDGRFRFGTANIVAGSLTGLVVQFDFPPIQIIRGREEAGGAGQRLSKVLDRWLAPCAPMRTPPAGPAASAPTAPRRMTE